MVLRSLKTSMFILLLLLPLAGHAQGYWDCYGTWDAWTTQREMRGDTKFECKGYISPWPAKCGDWSHSWGNTWVDIVGGLSQSCQDHSDSFFGPRDGEWHGCLSGNPIQISTGEKHVAGINQWWDRWPVSTYNGSYSPWTLNSYIGATFYMRDPFATVYDLDGCSILQDVGTVYWGNFPIQSQLVSGHPFDTAAGYVTFEFSGSAGLSCSWLQDECQTVVCSDLHVRKQLSCYWMEEYCGNGICDSSEWCGSCPEDCGGYCAP